MPSTRSYTTSVHACLYETFQLLDGEEVRAVRAHAAGMQLTAHHGGSDSRRRLEVEIRGSLSGREVGRLSHCRPRPSSPRR